MSLEQWEIFYRGGALATGPTGADGLYDQELAAVWQEYFDRLPTTARLLDLGTGNGVLPLMALAAARAKTAHWDIDATDLARIDPRNSVSNGVQRFESVRFHPGVANESLPFQNSTFDGVSGHYALEYGDTAQSLSEVTRVLKPDGQAQFVLHHGGSVLLSAARRSMSECELVFKKTRIHRKLRRLLSAEQPTPAALNRAQEELSQAIRLLRKELDEARARNLGEGRILAIALESTRALLAARAHTAPSSLALEVERAERELRSAWRRLNDLVAHAVDEQRFAQIRMEAEKVGLQTIRFDKVLHARNNLVGWLLALEKK